MQTAIRFGVTRQIDCWQHLKESWQSLTTFTKTLALNREYLYHWNRMGRKGEICKLLVIAGRMDSVLIEFQDGYKAVTSAKALRPKPAGYKPALQFDFGG